MAEISTLAAHISAATCRWMSLIAEFDRRQGWGGSGCVSCGHWVAFQCSMSLGAARDHVRVARRLEELPAIRASFACGELSYSKVRALTRIDGIADEQAVLELARHATAAQLERMVGAFRGVTREEADNAHTERFFRIDFQDDGSARIRGRLPAETAQRLMGALELANERRERPVLQAHEREYAGARDADALLWLADTAISGPDAGRSGGDREQVMVHVDAQTLCADTDGSDTPRCELADGTPMAAETVRRLCCDAAIVTALERDGSTLSVGRKTRSIPPSIRRALRSRQPTCQFHGCTNTKWLDAHHIKHWAHGGHTRLDNLVHLCHHHHQLFHEGGYTLDGVAPDGTLDIRNHRGVQLTPLPRARRGSCTQLVDDHARSGLAPAADTIQQLSYTARMDLGLCVDALLKWTDHGDGPEP